MTGGLVSNRVAVGNVVEVCVVHVVDQVISPFLATDVLIKPEDSWGATLVELGLPIEAETAVRDDISSCSC